MADSLHVVCSGCQAVNRLPPARLDEAPCCGRCHQPLFAGRPVELTAEAFEAQLGRSDLPVLVDFWAPWCGPCKAMAPQFAEAARLLEPRVRLAKVNADAEQALAARLGIQAIPTLALFRGGHEVARQAGAMGAEDLVRWTQAHLG